MGRKDTKVEYRRQNRLTPRQSYCIYPAKNREEGAARNIAHHHSQRSTLAQEPPRQEGNDGENHRRESQRDFPFSYRYCQGNQTTQNAHNQHGDTEPGTSCPLPFRRTRFVSEVVSDHDPRDNHHQREYGHNVFATTKTRGEQENQPRRAKDSDQPVGSATNVHRIFSSYLGTHASIGSCGRNECWIVVGLSPCFDSSANCHSSPRPPAERRSQTWRPSRW
jgi:hypothetical protein